MSSDWRVQICCGTCGNLMETPLSALQAAAAVTCPDTACGAVAALPSDLVESARFMFEESCRRLAAND